MESIALVVRVTTKQFIILDEDLEPLRVFNTKVDAEWFVKDKPDCSIKTTLTKIPSNIMSHDEFTAKFGEPPF